MVDDWRDRAACAGWPTDLWFPPHNAKSGSAAEVIRVRDAKEICGMCEVRQECLDCAFRLGIWYGIWGGLTSDERQRMTRARQRRARRSLAV